MTSKQSSALLFWLLLGVLAVIGYGSLFPFDFKFDGSHPTLSAAVSRLSWARAGRADLIRNVLLYLPLGFCLMLLLRVRIGGVWAMILATIIGMAVSFSIELAQVYLTIRVPSFMDVMLNTGGTVLGALAGLIWRRLSDLVYVPPTSRNRPSDRSAYVVVITWIIWRLAEFAPGISLSRLKLALWPLLEGTFALARVGEFLLWWLVVAQSVFAIARRQRSGEGLLIVIAIVMLGRLFFVRQPFDLSEIVALLVLLPSLVLLHKLNGLPQALLLMTVFLGWFMYEQLFPFQMASTVSAFDWWPFVRWFKPDGHIDPSLIMSKLFTYGALIWLFKEIGITLRPAVIVVVTLTCSIEVAHMWLTGRLGSITDPTLALVIGSVMRLISDENKSQRTRFKST